MVEGKLLNCIFWDDVACKHRKSETVTMMVRCWSCREFKRFVREMDKADAKIMDQIEKERSEGDSFG
jgi:hypothetical protein